MFKERYERVKKEFLNDSNVNSDNRKILKKFLIYEEYRLKRRNGLAEVDERSYKTLYSYIGKLKKINEWFKNKDWKKITKKEIKKVIDDLEDGVLRNPRGQRYFDRAGFYQIMQGELFRMVKKNHIVSDIIRDFGIKGRIDSDQVRFIPEEDFRKIVSCAITPEQKCLLWLAYDVGENINSLLELEKDDFKRQINDDTKEPEYLVILPKEKLKRSRTPRSEITNYRETVEFLDIVLNNLKPATKMVSNKYIKNVHLNSLHGENKLFKFKDTYAQRFLNRASELAKVRCMPEGQRVTWKDLRSSMACDLLRKEWTRDEVNARLGHRPSSRIIDRYINFLALDRKKPKKKVYDSSLKKIEGQLDEIKDREKLLDRRVKVLQDSEEMFSNKMLKFVEILQKNPEASKQMARNNLQDMKELFL